MVAQLVRASSPEEPEAMNWGRRKIQEGQMKKIKYMPHPATNLGN